MQAFCFEAVGDRIEKPSGAGDSVLSERCREEDRVLMTLDIDDARPGLRECPSIPSQSHPRIVVFRSKSQDKPTLVALLKPLVPALLQFSPKHFADPIVSLPPDAFPFAGAITAEIGPL